MQEWENLFFSDTGICNLCSTRNRSWRLAHRIPHRDEKTNGKRFQGTYSCSTPLQIQTNATKEDKEAAEFYKLLAADHIKNRVCLLLTFSIIPILTDPPLFLTRQLSVNYADKQVEDSCAEQTGKSFVR
jgi:hypothetical protein